MTIALINGELRQALAAAIGDWPVRWPNEPWPQTVDLSNGNLPTNPDGTPAPYAEVQTTLSPPSIPIGGRGNRLTFRRGIMRVHLVYPQGLGTVELDSKADDVEQFFFENDIQVDLGNWQRLTTENPTADDRLGVVENGTRIVRTVTVPWRFWYRT